MFQFQKNDLSADLLLNTLISFDDDPRSKDMIFCIFQNYREKNLIINCTFIR